MHGVAIAGPRTAEGRGTVATRALENELYPAETLGWEVPP